MARRIDVELTSARDDGTFTWRAAGAKAPKGVVASSVLYADAKVGDVVRAEVEIDVEGITILSVTPPKGRSGPPAGLLEIKGTGKDVEAVTTSLVSKSERPRGPRRDRLEFGDRNDRSDRGGPRPGGGGRGAGSGRVASVRDSGPREGGRDGAGRGGARGERPARTGDRPERSGDRPERSGDRRPAGRSGPREGGRQGTRESGRPRPQRLNPATTHRDAVLESLSPEQRPVAEQVLRGGIPAVRRAIDDQNAARAEGMPEVKAEALVALAEELLPRLKTAEWRDRADAAMAAIDTVGLRDLRSVVSAGSANARDDETRTLAASLREALDRRLKSEADEWTASIEAAMTEDRLVRALRLSTRAPDPAIRVPADLAMKLSAAASAGLSPETAPDRWAALLEAVVASPVRTTVKPAGLPADPGEPLLQAARQAAGRIPALAQLLGLALPPPPGAAKKAAGRPRPVPPPPSRPARAPERPVATPAATDEPVGAEPVPAAEAPAVEAPAAEAPATEAPATEAPAAETPAAEAPVAEAPASDTPDAPASDGPATESE